MNREKRGDKRAPPNNASPARTLRELLKQKKKQDGVRGMQEHVHQMMRARSHAEQLAIEHVRHRREWMPVVGMNVGERPDHVLPIEPGLNPRIVAYVNGVVVIHEVVPERLPENHKRDRDQREANRDFQNQLGAHNLVIVSRTRRANKLSILAVSA